MAQKAPAAISWKAFIIWLYGLILALIAVIAIVVFLARVLVAANGIKNSAADIKELGGGINETTAAVLELTTTNQVADRILNDVQPLSGQLGGILDSASSISDSARSISSTATAIDGTTGQIRNTAGAIQSSASSIAARAASIAGDVGSVNTDLATVLSLAQAIRADTAAIHGTAVSIDRHADDVDCKLPALPVLDPYPNMCTPAGP
jgi:uncharacterized protein YoxC